MLLPVGHSRNGKALNEVIPFTVKFCVRTRLYLVRNILTSLTCYHIGTRCNLVQTCTKPARAKYNMPSLRDCAYIPARSFLQKYHPLPFVNALRAIAYRGGSFSIDMNALRAIMRISRREKISIERIRQMNCVVRRTFTCPPNRYASLGVIHICVPCENALWPLW